MIGSDPSPNTGRAWWRGAVWVWLACLSIGLAILLVPEGAKTALLATDPWESVDGFFPNARPGERELSPEFPRDERDYLRSWTPERGATRGHVRSRPFDLPAVLAIPYAGYPGEPGIALYLERIDSGARLPVARGNVHENWTERTLWVPGSWRGQQARLVATTDSTTSYVALGVPRASSVLAWLKESVFVAVFVHALTFLLLLAPGAALVSFLPRSSAWPLPRSVWMLPLSCVLGYAVFFLAYHAPEVARVVTPVCSVVAVAAVVGRRHVLRDVLREEHQQRPLVALFLVSLAYVLLLYSADDGLGTWAATYRFTPAAWSTDNQIAQTVAEALRNHRPLAGLLGPWRVSDRPPLLTGLLLAQGEAWQPFASVGSNQRLWFLFPQTAAIVASTAWVLPLCMLGGGLRGRIAFAPWLVALAATTGFFTFHSLYVWPKLLAGTFGLGAFLCLVGHDRRPRPGWRDGAAAGLLGALALLCHGGVVFGLAAVALCTPRYKPTWGCVAAAAIVFGVMLAPWSHWQRSEDPPGNALVKSAFAQTHGWGEEQKGVLATVIDKYEVEGWNGWWHARLRAAATLVGAHSPDGVAQVRDHATDAIGEVRCRAFLFVFDALGIANIGWFLWPCVRRSARRATTSNTARAGHWLAVGVLGIAANLLLTWDMHVVHHQSYLSMVLLFAGSFALVLDCRPLVRRVFVVLHVGLYLTVWVAAPLLDAAIRWDHLVGFAVATVALAAFLVRWASAADPAAGVATSFDEPLHCSSR